jgi:hypothetical protein
MATKFDFAQLAKRDEPLPPIDKGRYNAKTLTLNDYREHASDLVATSSGVTHWAKAFAAEVRAMDADTGSEDRLRSTAKFLAAAIDDLLKDLGRDAK